MASRKCERPGCQNPAAAELRIALEKNGKVLQDDGVLWLCDECVGEAIELAIAQLKR